MMIYENRTTCRVFKKEEYFFSKSLNIKKWFSCLDSLCYFNVKSWNYAKSEERCWLVSSKTWMWSQHKIKYIFILIFWSNLSMRRCLRFPQFTFFSNFLQALKSQLEAINHRREVNKKLKVVWEFMIQLFRCWSRTHTALHSRMCWFYFFTSLSVNLSFEMQFSMDKSSVNERHRQRVKWSKSFENWKYLNWKLNHVMPQKHGMEWKKMKCLWQS